MTGNEAVAYGAVRAGIKMASGYPGTPSTGALEFLLKQKLPDTHVEWSTNEKVALEIAAGVAWGGHRALCTMKMSGINVAYDSLISIAYSGFDGALVIYVADDPGASAGMCEQDSRGFALISDMPMLEPATVAEAYEFTYQAFELSQTIKGPVFVRLVTAIANSYGQVELVTPEPVSQADAILERNIERFTKAGAKIGMDQHQDLINRLAASEGWMREKGLNELSLTAKSGGLGVISNGIVNAYLDEAFEWLAAYDVKRSDISILKMRASHPVPEVELKKLLAHCSKVVVLEELEPQIERFLYVIAQRMRYTGDIIGKIDGTLSRIGEYGVKQVVSGIAAGLDLTLAPDLFTDAIHADEIAAARPITVCAGCPHRGTYMGINSALKKLKLKKSEVMVTGDIGCTILGMNPPFNTIWNEISMGASVSLAQGFVYAGVKTPVIATIGDSTFFHGGMPGLINAIQHDVNMTLIIMDNRWTAMTGMQVNPGTPETYQREENENLDLVNLVQNMGVKQFYVVDPFNQEETVAAIQEALTLSGVKVIVARQECAIQSRRFNGAKGIMRVNTEKCTNCKVCLMVTGCLALGLGDGVITVDPALCYGCGLCATVCKFSALELEVLR